MDNRASVIRSFQVPDGIISIRPHGNGHINDTYLVGIEGDERQYILQRLNTYVFRKPDEVMENIDWVTSHLREKICREGGDPLRETLTLIRTRDGQLSLTDEMGGYWRMFLFVPGTTGPGEEESEALLEDCGRAFSVFARRLEDFDAGRLHETIPGFHNTPGRLRQLMDSVSEDPKGRLDGVREEVKFCLDREEETRCLLEAHARGEIPLRVTHNDTKVNNVLLDRASGRAICVVDLDTVMPGLAAYDFGDAIRIGASSAPEDEEDVGKIFLVQSKVEAFSRGFLSELSNVMGEKERRMLPEGALLMTLENGIRFLKDYLDGDVYYKIHRPDHNLVRARAQFALVREMEKNLEEMRRLICRIG